jgi:hypothetical protein
VAHEGQSADRRGKRVEAHPGIWYDTLTEARARVMPPMR